MTKKDINRKHGLFIDSPDKNSVLVVYARSIGKDKTVKLLRSKILEMPLAQFADDAFELMVTVENSEND